MTWKYSILPIYRLWTYLFHVASMRSHSRVLRFQWKSNIQRGGRGTGMQHRLQMGKWNVRKRHALINKKSRHTQSKLLSYPWQCCSPRPRGKCFLVPQPNSSWCSSWWLRNRPLSCDGCTANKIMGLLGRLSKKPTSFSLDSSLVPFFLHKKVEIDQVYFRRRSVGSFYNIVH